LIVLLLLLLAISVMINLNLLWRPGPEMPPRVREQFHSLNRSGRDKVAIITVSGIIFDEENGFVKRQIDQALKDDRVKAVVLRIDSPGGTVSDADYLLQHLSQLRKQKPLVVSMGGTAASGGYYIAMAVGDTPDTIFAEPTTWTGSIGVIIPHYNLETLFSKLGVEEDSVASHPLKNMGTPARKMTEEERRIFEDLVNDSFNRFKEVIRSGRRRFAKAPEELDRLATGQVFTASDAMECGLVDKIGFLEDAIDRAIELAGLIEDDVCVVRYKQEPSLSDLLWGFGQVRGHNWRELLQAVSPRPYYLMTFMPVWISSFGNRLVQ